MIVKVQLKYRLLGWEVGVGVRPPLAIHNPPPPIYLPQHAVRTRVELVGS